MLNELNQQNEIHIVTLEDPIEFMHPHAKATFSQRELGRDFPEFSAGLRSALRQAPKVILVGEIRDRETMEIALTAAETGHVVYSTLHTINAGQTINRILGFFGKDEEQLVRERLARYVALHRQPAPDPEGGRRTADDQRDHGQQPAHARDAAAGRERRALVCGDHRGERAVRLAYV